MSASPYWFPKGVAIFYIVLTVSFCVAVTAAVGQVGVGLNSWVLAEIAREDSPNARRVLREQVRIFSSQDYKKLEEDINKWLANNPGVKIKKRSVKTTPINTPNGTSNQITIVLFYQP